MKKTLLAFSLQLIFLSAFSQNWSVVNSSDKFNYRLDNDNIITATIWSDSVQWNGSDSVYYLNRIMCDTCVTIVGGPNPCDTCYAAKNRPQFFQRQVSVSSSGIVNFRDTGNIVINTLASLNDSWLFDSVQNISATVISVGMDSVLGSYDSLKTILLTSGDTVKLSQNFGVLQYPFHYGLNSYYRLVGIEGRNIGEQVPKFADFFNFNVGDMFEYKKTGGDADCSIEERRKYTITSRQDYPDSIVYNIQGITRHYEWPANWWSSCSLLVVWTYSTSLTYKDSIYHFANRYFRQAFNIGYDIQANYFFPNQLDSQLPCGGNDSAWDMPRLMKDSNGVTSKSFGIIPDWFGFNNYYRYIKYNNLDTLYIDPMMNQDGFAYTVTYKIGLGQTDYVIGGCFEGVIYDDMIAYRKGNDTVGVFTPDSMFSVGIKEVSFSNKFSLSPDPCSSYFNIQRGSESPAEITITDLQGQIIKSETIFGDHEKINVSDIENGLYFVLIKTSEGIFSQKIIILH